MTESRGKMPDHPLRRILSRILRGEDPHMFVVSYLHRGAPNDVVTIRASEITNVRKGSFLLSDEDTQIPFHRILEVKNTETGAVSWRKKAKPTEPTQGR